MHVNEGAFREYIAILHSYYPLSPSNPLAARGGQLPTAAEDLLADATYWRYILSNDSPNVLKQSQEVLKDLEQIAAANNTLRNRDTPERIIAQERRRVIIRWNRLYQRIWELITALHRLKGKYADNQAVAVFHTHMYQTYLAMPLKQKPYPIFLHPIGSIKSRIILDRTQMDDLIIEPLSFEDNDSKATSWIPAKGYVNPLGPPDPEASNVYSIVENDWRTIATVYREMQSIAPALTDTAALLQAYYIDNAPTLAERRALSETIVAKRDSRIWEMVRNEASRNARLGNQANTLDKLIQIRKNELSKKIDLLNEEQRAYEAAILPLEKEIEQEIASIDEQRLAYQTYLRRIIQHLIDDPGPLRESKMPTESDVKARLLSLGKRQALARVSENSDKKPQIYTMITADVPQAVQREEAERRHRLIREQTRVKYCQHRSKVEQEFQEDGDSQGESSPDTWYEE